MAQWPSWNWHDDMLDVSCYERFIFDIYLSRFCDDCTGSNVRMCNLFSMVDAVSNGSRLVRNTYPIYGNPFSVHIFFLLFA